MSATKDGGMAFPRPAHRVDEADGSSTLYYANDGMSLRDWFAGQALAGICGDGIPGSHHVPEATARDAYDYADAMLKAREQK